MLLLVSAIKLVAEIALFSMLGRWLLGLLAGAGRERNLFYQVLGVLVSPFTAALRVVTPRAVIDRHLPLLAFVALAWVWLFALLEKVSLCRALVAQGLCP